MSGPVDLRRRGFLRGDVRAASAPDASTPLVAVIGDRCLGPRGVECRICGEACEVDAIRFLPGRGGVWMPRVDVAACTGCGACVGRCPTDSVALIATGLGMPPDAVPAATAQASSVV